MYIIINIAFVRTVNFKTYIYIYKIIFIYNYIDVKFHPARSFPSGFFVEINKQTLVQTLQVVENAKKSMDFFMYEPASQAKDTHNNRDIKCESF